jgi:hypothetical protein
MRMLRVNQSLPPDMSPGGDSFLALLGHVEPANPGSTALEWHSLAGGVHDSPLYCSQ